jgi:hypothetical protein
MGDIHNDKMVGEVGLAPTVAMFSLVHDIGPPTFRRPILISLLTGKLWS